MSAKHIVIDTNTGETSTEPLTPEEQADYDAIAEAEANRPTPVDEVAAARGLKSDLATATTIAGFRTALTRYADTLTQGDNL